MGIAASKAIDRVRRRLSVATACGAIVLVAFTCCRKTSEPTASTKGGAGASGETSAAGNAGLTGRAGTDVASGGTAGMGGDADAPKPFWMPSGDPGWTAVDWAPDCLIEAATEPQFGMPELVWTACEGVPGCQRFDPSWYVKSQIYLGFASGYRNGNEARLGLGTAWGDGNEWRNALYDESWKPVAVWRGKGNDCNGVSPRPAPKHVCFRSAKVNGAAKGGLFAWNDLQSPITTFDTKGRLSMSCADDLVVGFSSSGANYIFDIGKGMESELVVATGEAFQPEAFGSTAYFSRWYVDANQQEALDGWIWTSGTGPQRLIDPGNRFVADLRSDGTNLVWLELEMTTIDHAARGKLWMSPVAETPEGVQRQFVRDVPSASITAFYKVVGGGFYAMVEQHDDQSILKLHLYRLKDGRHWELPLPDDLIPSTLVWVDTDELLLEAALPSGASHGLLRYTLSELGAGD